MLGETEELVGVRVPVILFPPPVVTAVVVTPVPIIALELADGFVEVEITVVVVVEGETVTTAEVVEVLADALPLVTDALLEEPPLIKNAGEYELKAALVSTVKFTP